MTCERTNNVMMIDEVWCLILHWEPIGAMVTPSVPVIDEC